MMAYLAPSEFVTRMIDAGESKVFMSTRDTIVRAYMAGAILALRKAPCKTRRLRASRLACRQAFTAAKA
jgi:formate/nitrite transporter FocA (FNT family)